MARHSPHYIDEPTVRRLLSVSECIDSVEEALSGYSAGTYRLWTCELLDLRCQYHSGVHCEA